MQNWLKIVLIAGGVWLATKIAAALSLKLSPGSISMQGSSLVVGLLITNTSNFSIAYDNFLGHLFINGVDAGAVYDNTAQDIIANGQTELNLVFTPQPGTLINSIMQEIQSGGASQTITLKGTLTAENIPVPITTSYSSPDLTGAVSQIKAFLQSL